MPSHTSVGIVRRVRACVSFRHTFNQRWKLGSPLDPKRLNDANDPSRQQDAANHGGAELSAQSNRVDAHPHLLRAWGI